MDHIAYLKELSSKPIPKELPFSESEYQERVAKVRKRMDEAGLSVLLVTFLPNIHYLDGFNAMVPDFHACLILPREGDPVIQATSIEAPVALLSGWIEQFVVYNYDELGLGGISRQLANILRELGLANKTIGVEIKEARFGLSADVYGQLQRELPSARFQDASDIVLRERMIKSPKELEYLRESGRITYEGIKAALAAIAPGKTDNDVAKAGYEAMVGAGSEFMSTQPTTTSGHRVGWCHTTFRRVPLKVGDTVYLEYGSSYQRYTAPMMRTAFIGQPTDQVMRLTEAVKDTFNRILESARPGRTGHEVALEAHKGHKAIDSEMFFSGVYGYAVGISFASNWLEGSAYIAEGIEQPLLPGMTFHLPTCFRVPGKLGVGLSETVAITESTCEVLTQKERDLYIVST